MSKIPIETNMVIARFEKSYSNLVPCQKTVIQIIQVIISMGTYLYTKK